MVQDHLLGLLDIYIVSIKLKNNVFIYLLAVFGVGCCTGSSLIAMSGGYSLVAEHGL